MLKLKMKIHNTILTEKQQKYHISSDEIDKFESLKGEEIY